MSVDEDDKFSGLHWLDDLEPDPDERTRLLQTAEALENQRLRSQLSMDRAELLALIDTRIAHRLPDEIDRALRRERRRRWP